MDNKIIEEIAKDIVRSAGLGVYEKAEYLYDLGYRKIPENAVVIEKTEYDKLRLLADECLDWRRKCCNVAELPKENAVVLTREEFSEKIENTWLNCQEFTRKETVEKFKALLKGTVPQGLLDEIAKEFKEGE